MFSFTSTEYKILMNTKECAVRRSICCLRKYVILIILCLLPAITVFGNERYYRCEFGVMGGLAYYTGDANPHIFQHVAPSYGGYFRYKFTPRWALRAKVQYGSVGYKWEDQIQQSRIGQLDAIAEYNFFRLRLNGIDQSARAYSPYLFLGFGLALHGDLKHFGPYMPFGVGFKWQMAPRWSMNIEWQQELFFCDNVEGIEELNNTVGLNKSNFLRNDLVSTLTLGIGFHFLREKPICRRCDW